MIRFESVNSPVITGVRQNNTIKNKDIKTDNQQAVTSLPDIKMPVAVNIPSGYTKLGVTKLNNGQEIHNYRLSNGLRVSIVPMDSNFTMVRTFVNTGAINEDDNQRGISHFLEHMAFNGTLGADGYKKLSTGDVFRIVGNIGGDTNASTNFALTDYYIQAPIFYDSDLEEIISIQGAMMNNLALPDNMIEKERGPVISEINMYTDFPNSTAYNMALKNLYNLNTTSDDYIAGRVENIKKLSRDDVLNYYRNNYYPANMYTTLAGDVNPDEAIKLIAKHFHTTIQNPQQRKVNKLTPINEPVRRDFTSPKVKEMNGYMCFNGPANNNLKDAIVMQFLSALLVGNSNALIRDHFTNQVISINMGMEKVSTLPSDGQAVYFEFYGADEKTDFILKTIYDELANFKKPSDKQVALIKKSILNSLDKQLQDTSGILTLLGTTHFKSGDNSITEYANTINSITPDDIVECAKKYLDLNKVSIAIVHPQKETQQTSTSPAFTGVKEKRVIKPDNAHVYNLGNNYEAVSYDTQSDYRYLNYALYCDKIPESKPGTAELLDLILNNGTSDIPKKVLKEIFLSKLISNSVNGEPDGIRITTHADKGDMKLAVGLLKKQLLNPAFTEEGLKDAKHMLKEALLKDEPSAKNIIYNRLFPNCPYYYSSEQILDNIDNITLEDIKNLYHYILANGHGEITFTTSKDEPAYTEEILSEFNTLPKVKNKTYKLEKNFTPVKTPEVLTRVTNNSQADIKIGYTYKTNLNLRDSVTFDLLNSLLRKNAFNDLREKQQLAYHVNSSINYCFGDTGILFCGILTTTEEDETGEKSYENVQKSIDGFKKLIEDLKNGNFTNEELEAVKLEKKSLILEMAEHDYGKIYTISGDQTSPYGVLTTNLEYSMIDTITKEDIIKAANYIFNNNKPVYGITATKATLEANKDYFQKLEAEE